MQAVLKALVKGEGAHKKPAWSVPLRYKIRKDSRDFRRLALVHPRAQWRIREFYERYETLILHYCAVSPVSIRAPEKVASSFFIKSAWENLYALKAGSVSLITRDQWTKHSPSYFAYRGFDRLYKFFESASFFSLEKKYSYLRTLDVSKCFDSIYTHSLSWAVKDKEFTKQNISVGGTFAQAFDRVMQFANHSETNGIVIGPEVSRIFAEIILQKVDVLTISLLRDSNLTRGVEYEVRRYVDDVFIFATTRETADAVYKRYADVLMDFNLYANASKSVMRERPFTTSKSRLVSAASVAVNSFIDKFLTPGDQNASLEPSAVRSEWKLTRSLLDSLKSICAESDAGYDEIASYVLAVLTERVKKLVNNEVELTDFGSQKNHATALLVLLDAQFFLYSVSPTVSSSYRLCTSMLLAIKFARSKLPIHLPIIAQRIYDLVLTHLTRGERDDDVDIEAFLSLETLNLLLAARELGAQYLLPAAIIQRIFERDEALSYFQIMCCLWYTRGDAQYASVREKIMNAAAKIMGDLSSIASDTEQAYLFLDLVSCPFVERATKFGLARLAAKALQLPVPTNAALDEFVADAAKGHSHVDWAGVDLLNLLERKELKQVY
jgi:hypothetical protein